VAPANLASFDGFFSRMPQAITAALLQAIAADGPGVAEDEVRAIKVPTLVIGHGRDEVHPLAYAEALAALIREPASPGSPPRPMTPPATLPISVTRSAPS